MRARRMGQDRNTNNGFVAVRNGRVSANNVPIWKVVWVWVLWIVKGRSETRL
jgi:hypothetical protein